MQKSIGVFIIQDIRAAIPAKAGIRQDINPFCLNPLDSRFRGNDEPDFHLPNSISAWCGAVFNYGNPNKLHQTRSAKISKQKLGVA